MNSKKTYSELFLYVTGVTETRSKVCLGILTDSDRDCHAFNTLLTSKGREIHSCAAAVQIGFGRPFTEGTIRPFF